jgi:hypothetical protein
MGGTRLGRDLIIPSNIEYKVIEAKGFLAVLIA